MLELNNLKLLAFGGQAEIYELDENKVIRVLRSKEDEKNLKIEMSIMNSLEKKGKAVPKVYEYLEIGEKPSLIMERLYGNTMIEELKKNPLKLMKIAEKLARLHIEITASAEGLDLISANARASYLIPKAEMLDDESRKFVLDILKELPKGNDICHGDFHPGNIIGVDGKCYVIDWFGATCGNKLSDIAHSYILLRNTPEVPGMSRLQSLIMNHLGKLIAGKYLSTCVKLHQFNWNELSKWMVVKGAERVFYGSPLEKEGLIKFINKCMKAHSAGIEPSNWWKFI